MHYLRLFFLILFLSFPVSVWAMGEDYAEAYQDPLIGQAAPDVVLPNSDGTSASIINAREGKKAILVFWATWCPHCYVELGKINAVLLSVQEKGIKIILVDVGESKEDVKEYLMRRQMNLSCFIDEDNVLHDPYHLIGVPTMVFIDKQGTIRHVTHQFPSDYENYFSGK
jgi:peroxiredoxin